MSGPTGKGGNGGSPFLSAPPPRLSVQFTVSNHMCSIRLIIWNVQRHFPFGIECTHVRRDDLDSFPMDTDDPPPPSGRRDGEGLGQ